MNGNLVGEACCLLDEIACESAMRCLRCASFVMSQAGNNAKEKIIHFAYNSKTKINRVISK